MWVASSNGWPRDVQWRENRWKLGRRKVMEAFARSRWRVRNENKSWRALNRVLSDCWFLYGLLEFKQGCKIGLHTLSNFAQVFARHFRKAKQFRKAKVGVRIFHRVCKIFAPLAN